MARLLLDQGYRVVGTSRDAQTANFGNLDRLGIRARAALASMVLTDFRSTLQTLAKIAPDELYNLAGQTSVDLSFEQPVETLKRIATGTLNLLEAIRFLERPIRLYNAGSSECFGDTGGVAATKDTPFRPRSPYAVAKATAHWEGANYREAYGLFACSGILFNHESPLRPERFVTRKIVAAFTEHALDWRDHVEQDPGLFRPSDIAYNGGDASQARVLLNWQARYQMPDVVRLMVAAERDLTEGNSKTQKAAS